MRVWLILLITTFGLQAHGEEKTHVIALQDRGTGTFYVQGKFGDLDPLPLLVDTGSSYSSINPSTLDSLEMAGDIVFLRSQLGILANGNKIEIPLYRIKRLTLGQNCHLHDTEVAVFPNGKRIILGLNALRILSPFSITTEPPQLTLSGCQPTNFQPEDKSPSLARAN